MIWVLVIIYSSPNSDQLMRSYHEYKTKEECVRELERAKSFPHPFGLKVDLSCNQAVIKFTN